MMNRNPISRKSLTDEVVDKLQHYISSGKYKPNEKLPTESALMEHFQVGRSTIREAVRILSNCDVVYVQHGIGIFVHPSPETGEPLSKRLKRADVENIFEVKLLLEMKIAEKAATHRKENHIRKMEAALENRALYGKEAALDKCIEADVNFHIAIAEACGNDILADLYKAFGKRFMESYLKMDSTWSTDKLLMSQQLHRDLLESIIQKKPETAWELAQKIALGIQ